MGERPKQSHTEPLPGGSIRRQVVSGEACTGTHRRVWAASTRWLFLLLKLPTLGWQTQSLTRLWWETETGWRAQGPRVSMLTMAPGLQQGAKPEGRLFAQQPCPSLTLKVRG